MRAACVPRLACCPVRQRRAPAPRRPGCAPPAHVGAKVQLVQARIWSRTLTALTSRERRAAGPRARLPSAILTSACCVACRQVCFLRHLRRRHSPALAGGGTVAISAPGVPTVAVLVTAPAAAAPPPTVPAPLAHPGASLKCGCCQRRRRPPPRRPPPRQLRPRRLAAPPLATSFGSRTCPPRRSHHICCTPCFACLWTCCAVFLVVFRAVWTVSWADLSLCFAPCFACPLNVLLAVFPAVFHAAWTVSWFVCRVCFMLCFASLCNLVCEVYCTACYTA